MEIFQDHPTRLTYGRKDGRGGRRILVDQDTPETLSNKILDASCDVSAAIGGGGGGTPSAPDGSIQFNNSGSFGGSANATLDGGGNGTMASLTLNTSLKVPMPSPTNPAVTGGTSGTLAAGTYNVKIGAVDMDGNETDLSSQVNFTIAGPDDGTGSGVASIDLLPAAAYRFWVKLSTDPTFTAYFVSDDPSYTITTLVGTTVGTPPTTNTAQVINIPRSATLSDPYSGNSIAFGEPVSRPQFGYDTNQGSLHFYIKVADGPISFHLAPSAVANQHDPPLFFDSAFGGSPEGGIIVALDSYYLGGTTFDYTQPASYEVPLHILPDGYYINNSNNPWPTIAMGLDGGNIVFTNFDTQTALLDSQISQGFTWGIGIAPSGNVADAVQMWVEDTAPGDARLHILGESGTAVVIGNGSVTASGLGISGLTTPTNKPVCFAADGSLYAGTNSGGTLSCP